MKYVINYREYNRLNEAWSDLNKFEKGFTALRFIADGCNRLMHGLYTKKQQIALINQNDKGQEVVTYPNASPFNAKNLLKYGGILAGGVAVTIALIYFLMYQHDKKLDKLTPLTKSMLIRYKNYLDDEFSPKELDDLYRIISTDQQILMYVHEYFNTEKASKNAEDYLNKKLTKRQIEGIVRVQSKMTGNTIQESELYENVVDKVINDYFEAEISGMVKGGIKGLLFSLPFILIFSFIPDMSKKFIYNMLDPHYSEKLHQYQILLNGQFNKKELSKINSKLMSSQRFISYLQRMSRSYSYQDRKDLEKVMFEHITGILSKQELDKFKYIIEMGHKMNLFDSGMVTAFSVFTPNSVQVASGGVSGALSLKF